MHFHVSERRYSSGPGKRGCSKTDGDFESLLFCLLKLSLGSFQGSRWSGLQEFGLEYLCEQSFETHTSAKPIDMSILWGLRIETYDLQPIALRSPIAVISLDQ